jgi:basic membrane lipoprotein Med (substrate-binding protein (PBP1-ABC) superfamily)/DNA-binding SARP family transcriptional activator
VRAIRLLGPLEVEDDSGGAVPLGPIGQRALLALLALRVNEVVSMDRLVDELWDGSPPRTAEHAVQVYVSRLRRLLEPERRPDGSQLLVRRGAGYTLQLEPSTVDDCAFEQDVVEGDRLLGQDEFAAASAAYRRGLELWRSEALEEFRHLAFARDAGARFDELKLIAQERAIAAEMAFGDPGRMIPELETLVRDYPLRERLRGQLMLALYRAGRQADALTVFQDGRRRLVDDLGLEPGIELRELEQAILQHDRALDTPVRATPQGAGTDPVSHRRGRRRSVRYAGFAAFAAAAAVVVAVAISSGDRSRAPLPTSPTSDSGSVTLVNEFPASGAAQNESFAVGPEAGVRAAARDLGLQPVVVDAGFADAGFVAAVDRAAQRSRLVLIGATPNLASLKSTFQRHPRTRFVISQSIAGTPFARHTNVTGLAFDDYEAGYLAGFLAAAVAHPTNVVSVVGGIRTEPVLQLVAGFRAGALRADPTVRILASWSGTFLDQKRCATVADGQIRAGSRVVFDAAGICGLGAMQAAAIHGVRAIGVDSDLSYLGPHVIASSVKRFDRAEQLAVTLFARGQLQGGDLRLNLGDDALGLVGLAGNIPSKVRTRLERLINDFRNRDQRRNHTTLG